jgi:hypothetical protein
MTETGAEPLIRRGSPRARSRLAKGARIMSRSTDWALCVRPPVSNAHATRGGTFALLVFVVPSVAAARAERTS